MPARFLYAASNHDADMLHATQFRAPDAFAFVQSGGCTAAMLSDLEIDRGRKEAKVDAIVALSDVKADVAKKLKREPKMAEILAAFLKANKATHPLVPGNFPAGLAVELAEAGIRVKPVAGHFWPDREFKTPSEIRAITAAIRVTETGLARAFEILKASRIRKDRKLEWGGGVLTSERLRAELEAAMLFEGAVAANDSIVACGSQACDPHERGHGPLKANELIILDIFPRIAKTGFYGDLTRTVVRGRASDAQRQLWETCLDGQRQALKALRPGVKGKAVQDSVRGFFTVNGYPTEQRDGRWQGFFHGLGHGLGLDLHEEPRIAATTFKPGQVFTVEPGIYVPGIGGVRHEDVVVITGRGNRLLSRFPKPFEI